MARIKPSEQQRQRTLTDDEIRALWRAVDADPSAFGCLVQFLLLTAVRRNEAARMRRCEVAGDDWIVPPERYKTDKELVIPLSPAAKAVHLGRPLNPPSTLSVRAMIRSMKTTFLTAYACARTCRRHGMPATTRSSPEVCFGPGWWPMF
jgi:integrase